MGNLFSGDRDVNILLMAWADHHPYLFTLIKITQPYLLVIIAVAGSNLISKLFRAYWDLKNVRRR